MLLYCCVRVWFNVRRMSWMMLMLLFALLILGGLLAALQSKQPESWTPFERNFWSLAWSKHSILTETLLSDYRWNLNRWLREREGMKCFCSVHTVFRAKTLHWLKYRTKFHKSQRLILSYIQLKVCTLRKSLHTGPKLMWMMQSVTCNFIV